MRQSDRVLEYLKENGSITSLIGFTELGILSFPKRINELRSRGIKISDKYEIAIDRNGNKVSYKRYTLEDTNV